MQVHSWSRRRFMTVMAGASASWWLVACSAKTTEQAPAAAADGPFAALQAGQGAVVKVDGQDVAAYKTDAGQVIKLSASCPHQGCPVEWDENEKRWVCPCHGSQFQPDGTLISGPAGKGLEKLG